MPKTVDLLLGCTLVSRGIFLSFFKNIKRAGLKRPFSSKMPAPLLIALFAASLFYVSIATPSFAQAPAIDLRNPEGRFGVSFAGCKADSHCPPPADSTCKRAACRNGTCEIVPKVGQVVPGGQSQPSDPLSCVGYRLVCGVDGVARPDPNSRIPSREGQACAPSAPITNSCITPVCRSGACVLDVAANNGQLCPEAADSAGPCETGMCDNGACLPRPDPKKVGTRCAADQPDGCGISKYSCSAQGTCDVSIVPMDGMECVPGQPLPATTALPAPLRALFVSSASPPSFSCGEDCTFEYCGDGRITGTEQCDVGIISADPSNAVTCDPVTCLIIPNTGTIGGGNSRPAVARPATTQRPCVWIAAWGHRSTLDRSETNKSSLERYLASRPDRETWTSLPSCFSERFAGVCGSRMTQYASAGAVVYSDCMAKDPKSTLMHTDFFTPEVLANFLGVKYTKTRAPTAAEGAATVLHWYDYKDTSLVNPDPAMWYMDANCKAVPKTDNQVVCGFGGVTWSPISLVFDQNASINEDMKVVKFAIDPRHPDSFSLWKASEKAPLLVYDPKRTGKITSARQLFGNFAFGGRTTDILSYDSESLREPWNNGFEALALLDSNHDGKIAGDELSPLSLWFDKNRNGLSEEGEVLPASEKQITGIYYSDIEKINGSKDLQILNGFTRTEADKEIAGPAIDWFAETFANQQEATEVLRAMLSHSKDGATYTVPAAHNIGDSIPPELQDRAPGQFAPHIAADHSMDLSGYWMWYTKDEAGLKHPGFFAFEQKGDRVVGYSIVESPLENNPQGHRAAIRLFPVEGSISRSADGKVTLAMSVIDILGQGTAHSTATISPGGTTISGRSTQDFSTEINGQKLSASTDYDWEALKIIKDK